MSAIAAAAILVAMAAPAEAARRKLRGGGYSPPFAALVVDAKTGRTLYARNENELRFPASITKVMTLYVLFEQMERGRFKMDSELRVSARAAMQAPSKIGFEPGESISVEDAVMALITKSANDVAVTVAENVSGSEENFALEMTKRARAIGMSRTTFKNASGLPNEEQVTTARDLAILARAIQERFPRQFALFQTRAFSYAGVNYRNHNKLLGRIEGVDGIKTGYTRKSGFNLMTSAKRDGRHVVAIVLGGKSGAVRDRIMANLLEEHIDTASAGGRTAPVLVAAVTERDTDSAVAARPAVRPRPAVVAEAATTGLSSPAQLGRPLTMGGVVPVAGKDQARILPATAQAFAATTTPPAFRWASGAPARIQPEVEEGSALPMPLVPIRTAVKNPDRLIVEKVVAIEEPKSTVGVAVLRSTKAAETETLGSRSDASGKAALSSKVPVKTAAKDDTRVRPEPEVMTTGSARSGWIIQLGATDVESKARDILDRAKAQERAVLARAAAFTQPVSKGGATLYRARFSGFNEDSAQDACKALKRNGFACFATRG